MGVKIEILGVPEMIKKIGILKNKIINAQRQSLIEAGEHLRGEIILSISGQREEPRSVDTGNFMRSIQKTVDTEKAVIKSDVSYSKELEFGTSNRPARSHFQNSANREETKIKEIINKTVKNALKS